MLLIISVGVLFKAILDDHLYLLGRWNLPQTEIDLDFNIGCVSNYKLLQRNKPIVQDWFYNVSNSFCHTFISVCASNNSNKYSKKWLPFNNLILLYLLISDVHFEGVCTSLHVAHISIVYMTKINRTIVSEIMLDYLIKV